MKLGIPLIFVGIIFILIPITLVQIWPNPKNQSMPADLSVYPNSYYSPKSERLSSWNDKRLARLDKESDFEFATRMLATVHNATYHCEAHNYQQSWFTWLSWRTGFYLLLPRQDFGVLDLKTFRCGFCHQRSYILAKVLRRAGISSAEILGITGHVITVITTNQELYALDPDLGIGPIKVTGIDTTDGILNSEIKKHIYDAYQPISNVWGKEFTDDILNFYITRSNNEYYNFLGLEIRRLFQSILFSFERIIEVYFMLLGATLIYIGFAINLIAEKNFTGILKLINRSGNFQSK